ncbi:MULTISPECIES: ABC transporter ATP-binding protein [unclassified Streptomyces]|uniref:dipeptide ABC transporter ATP-binding protein n=1 Tax=unclassified Streptomyces TaxID=2593676 RepID=UPI0011CA4BDD|nr:MULTISPECIES: ABC transporter ATP-binding protein [unclassified Streptomyces]TXS17931.1 ABC transporter ATP-binding protein [Streptomyces sp. wa22]WSQ77704.1 ABC transporter ATP-binding protein [Streptomyces sp. NBC_01213]WSR48417.1 ABC transporter ATP-binding protein [Streptomyces sp. NBC_01201]
MTTPLVQVEDLTIDFGAVRAVDGLSFTLEAGAALGVVGESGSGKSASASALLGLHRGTGARVTGTVRVAGTDVGAADEAELRALRGAKAAMVFQDPLSSLDPYYTVGDQIAEVYRVHNSVSRRAARARAVEVLDRVGIPDAARRARSRPHEFSGGMRQRALIAMALACEPRLIVADEPTTALDVTVQAQILDLLHDLRRETGTALLLVTHDVGVAAESVDDVLVMQHGRTVERGPVAEVLGAPRQPYTRELLASVPRVDSGRSSGSVPGPRTAPPGAGPLLEAVGLRREFGRGSSRVTAVDDVSLTVHAGETLGIVGESGSGKTTLGRMLVRLDDPTAGRLRYGGREIGSLPEKALRPFRRELQMVFQDPVASLNPRRSVGESVADPLRAAGETDETRIRDRVSGLLERVGLDAGRYERYPHEFSGGQRQRIGIARVLAAEPKLIVCDEPVSALDVTTQAQVIALLAELQRELGIGLVFIAHDLAVVRQVSDRVAVMRQGRIVEQGAVDEVYGSPQDAYTKQLLAAVPTLDPAHAAARRAARSELALA